MLQLASSCVNFLTYKGLFKACSSWKCVEHGLSCLATQNGKYRSAFDDDDASGGPNLDDSQSFVQARKDAYHVYSRCNLDKLSLKDPYACFDADVNKCCLKKEVCCSAFC